jgi:hypothetical protein
MSYEVLYYPYFDDFTDKVYYSQLRNESIKDLCLSGTGQSFNHTLAGDIQNEFQVVSEEALKAVTEELYHHMDILYPNRIQSLDIEKDLWINYQKAGEFNPCHNHKGIYSFVFYASVPEEIRQEHLNSYSGNTQKRGLIEFHSARTNDFIDLNPKENDILVFENSHIHQVYPFYSNNTRISIAGNIRHIEWI